MYSISRSRRIAVSVYSNILKMAQVSKLVLSWRGSSIRVRHEPTYILDVYHLQYDIDGDKFLVTSNTQIARNFARNFASPISNPNLAVQMRI